LVTVAFKLETRSL